MDLRSPRIASEVFGWVKSGLIWRIWLGTPCSVRSTSRRQGRHEGRRLRIRLRSFHSAHCRPVLENVHPIRDREPA